MSNSIEVWPSGDIVPAVAHIDGKTYIRISFTDPNGTTARLGFDIATFVAVADHLRTLADALAQDPRALD